HKPEPSRTRCVCAGAVDPRSPPATDPPRRRPPPDAWHRAARQEVACGACTRYWPIPFPHPLPPFPDCRCACHPNASPSVFHVLSTCSCVPSLTSHKVFRPVGCLSTLGLLLTFQLPPL